MSYPFPADPVDAAAVLDARCEPFDTALVVTVSGELDATSMPELEVLLMTAMDDAGPYRDVVVDLTETSYMDSSGLSLLLRCHERGSREGTALRVVASTRAVLRPIQITGLDETLLLYLAVADAIAAR